MNGGSLSLNVQLALGAETYMKRTFHILSYKNTEYGF